MAEKRPHEVRQKAEEQQPEIKPAPERKRKAAETEPPESIEEDVAIEDRFQSTDN
jgi:hypothetical protein